VENTTACTVWLSQVGSDSGSQGGFQAGTKASGEVGIQIFYQASFKIASLVPVGSAVDSEHVDQPVAVKAKGASLAASHRSCHRPPPHLYESTIDCLTLLIAQGSTEYLPSAVCNAGCSGFAHTVIYSIPPGLYCCCCIIIHICVL
jgi:hypothetical protein